MCGIGRIQKQLGYKSKSYLYIYQSDVGLSFMEGLETISRGNDFQLAFHVNCTLKVYQGHFSKYP